MEAARSPQDIYARHVSSSRGYPMWTPEPSYQLLSYRPEGLRIGDVGVVIPEDGNFDVFFNLCLQEEEQFHKSSGVPDGFNPIQLSEADIRTTHDVETPGQIIKGSSVARVGKDGAPISEEVLPITSQSGTTRYNFNMSSTEGALLILPDGADRHDIRDPRPFFEQACRHAATWYQFAEEKLGRIISHDSIYVITGFHKARSWGLAAYENEEDNEDFSSYFIVRPREDNVCMAPSCGWETTRNMDWRVGPYDGLGIANQSVFIRGFKIAMRSKVQGVPQRWVSYQPNPRSGVDDSLFTRAVRAISRTMGISGEGAGNDPRENMLRVEISRIPEILPVFHPLDVINQYILQKEPSARVAITHDSSWSSLLDNKLIKPEEFVQDELLTKAISERYTVVVRGGVAYLQNKNGSDVFSSVARDDFPATKVTDRAAISGAGEPAIKGGNKVVQASHPESLSVVSESDYRCIDDTTAKSVAPESRPAGLQSIPSKFGVSCVDTRPPPGSLRPIKIIVISDYVCAFCYICEKILFDAVQACQDLPVRFDVETRPFTLVHPSALPRDQIVWRNPYLVKKFGKEQAEIKLMAVNELSQKAGLKLADDSIVAVTTQVHRMAAKAYKDGGQELQNKFNTFIFDACLAKKANLGDEAVLVDAAVSTGLMNKEEATAFLHSTEHLVCVEKMVEAARAQGINGVPFVIIDGKWAVNGLQPVECFIQIFRKLAHLPASLTDAGRKEAEHEVRQDAGITCRLPS